jgi:hypothetical protein
MSENEDVRQRRTEMVREIHRKLKDVEGAYWLNEGYREVFLEIRNRRPEVV